MFKEIKTIEDCEYNDYRIEFQVDYDENKNLYRASKFVNYHFAGDVLFNGYTNAYCPICDKERWIPDIKGYCCRCGHHLNRREE